MSPTPAQGTTALRGVPQTLDELNEQIGRFFRAQRQVKSLKSRLAERLQKIKDSYAPKVSQAEAEEKGLFGSIQTASEARRAEFTADGTKSKKFENGTVGWRNGNMTHVLSAPAEEVIAALEEMGLEEFVIIKKELDVEGLIRRREELPPVPGLSFKREERFYIAPPRKKRAKASQD